MCEKCDIAEAEYLKTTQEIFDGWEKTLLGLRDQAIQKCMAAYERKLEVVRAAHPLSPSL
jgi:hypothetical protein